MDIIKYQELKARDQHLSDSQIENLRTHLEKNSSLQPIYGNVPQVDSKGEVYGYKFDVRRTVRELNPDAPRELKEALMRPSTEEAIIYHLIRLGTHVAYTKGKEALSAAVYDLAKELKGVSEWAVIEAVREYWTNSDNKYYPESGVILKMIRDKHDEVLSMVSAFDGFLLPKSDLMEDTAKTFGRAVSISWFGRCRYESGLIITPNKFVMEWIKNNYLSKLKEKYGEKYKGVEHE